MKQKRIFSFSVLFLILFALVAYFRGAFNEVNLTINLWSATINHGFFTQTALIISIVFDTLALAIISFLLAIVFFVFHLRRYGLLLLGAMAGDAVLVALFKTIIMSPRPSNGIVFASGYSFPSGHTTSSVVFFGILTYFVWKNYEPSKKVKALTAGLYVFITAVIGFDRVYLNVHWFGDLIGSVFLGAFWLTTCILLFKHLMSTQKIRPFLDQKTKSQSTQSTSER